MMGDHLYGSSIRDGVDVPQFNYYGVSIVGHYFDEYILMYIGKNWCEKDNYELRNTFQNGEGDLKGGVTDSRIT